MGTRKQRSALRVEGAVAVAQAATFSTVVNAGAFQFGTITSLSTTQTVTAAPGILIIAGASQTFTMPTPVAGEIWFVHCSSGATNVISQSTAGVTFDSLLASGATTLTLSTDDSVIFAAQTATNYIVLAASTNVTST